MDKMCLARKPSDTRHGFSLQKGSTLIEAMLGTAVASLGIASLCVANAECLNIAHAHREMLTADRCLQQRADQFRAANWTQITDPAGISALLAVAPVNDDSLYNHAEKVTVSPYPAVAPAVAPIVVTNNCSTGTTAVASQPPSGFILRNVVAVRIDFQETWSSSNGRSRSRESSTVVAFGGLLSN